MKKCLLFLSLFIQILGASAQNCNNIGFENGTLTNWVLSYGVLTDDNVRTLYGTEINGSVESEHIITRASSGNDPRVYTEAIQQAAPAHNKKCTVIPNKG